MELQLERKITASREDDDRSDVSELWRAQHTQDAVCFSTETPSMFILTAHLHGYKRNSIEIKIKEDGREIFTTGEKPIQKLVIMGQVMRENQEEILGLTKVFKIPNGVVLDQIKAEYNQEEAELKICMPKFVKQVCGIQIEEVTEEDLGEPSQKAFKELEVQLIENPRVEIQNGYGDESVREEDDQEEIEEGKNSEMELNVEDRISENIGEKTQEVPQNIVIQSLEESDNGVIGMEIGEEIIGGRKEQGIEGPNELEIEDGEKERVEEDISKDGLEAWETTMKREKSEDVFPRRTKVSGEDIVEGIKLKEIEEPKHESEDRDIQVKEGIEELDQFETEDNNKGSIAEEIGKELKQLPMEPKEPLQMEETNSVAEIIEGTRQIGIEEPMLGRVKYETCEEGSQALETIGRWELPKTQKHVPAEAKEKGEVFEAIENEEKGKTYECGGSEHQESQVPKKQDSQLAFQESTKTISVQLEVKLLRSSLESPLVPQFVKNKREVIGQRETHEADGQRDEARMEISTDRDELKDIQVEAIEEDKAHEQICVEISQELEKLREIEFKESEEKKKLHAPLVFVGSALVVSLVVFFIRHRRVEKSN